jgi:hypothetical protein
VKRSRAEQVKKVEYLMKEVRQTSQFVPVQGSPALHRNTHKEERAQERFGVCVLVEQSVSSEASKNNANPTRVYVCAWAEESEQAGNANEVPATEKTRNSSCVHV